jgi:quercetin dioxygenase-like cupin family protein
MNERPLIESGAAKILSLAEETKFAANGIVSRTLLRTANSRTVLFGFAEGQELTEHTSTQHALIQILSGECEFSLDGKAHALKAGDFLYMPPNLPHAVCATTQFSMLLTLTKPATAEKFEAFLTEPKPNLKIKDEQPKPR